MEEAAAVELTGVGVRFGARQVLRDLDLRVRPGELLALVGPSGAGKSTLLQVLAGLRRPDAGVVHRSGGERSTTGLVSQHPHLLPWRTVAGNVALGLAYRRNGGRWPRPGPGGERVARLLEELGIADLADRFPSQLSGGQAQRVALARAIVIEPHLLLLDEPFGALDPVTRRDLQDWLLALHRRRGPATVLVTHDLDEALLLGDRVGLLGTRPGPIEVVPSSVTDRAGLADGSAHRALLARFAADRDVRDVRDLDADDGGRAPGRSPGAGTGAAVDRRRVLQVAGSAALLAAPFVAAAVTAPPAAPRRQGPAVGGGPLRVGYLPITDAAPLLLAHAEGDFSAVGLDVPRPVLFRSWPDLAEALQSGTVDVVHMLMPLAVQLRHGAGLPVRVLLWNHVNGSALTVRPDVDSLAQLAGTTVAVPFWHSIHNIVLQQLLRSSGLTPVLQGEASAGAGEVKLALMAPSDMPPALAAGQVAGFTVAEPFNAAAEVQGIGKVLRFTGDVWKDHACCVTVVHQRLLDERPAAAAAAVQALVAAQRRLRDRREGAARTLSDGGYLPQPLAALERTLATGPDAAYVRDGAIQHPGWQQRRIGFQPYPYPSYTAQLVRAMKETAVVGDTAWLEAVDPDGVHGQLVREDLVLRAIRSSGGFDAFGSAGPVRTEVVLP
ncbi:ABC transporter substrate-binding protein [Kineococcus sp. LSe6-4]|uniref:ABC transporter substrate-binding protein n=1 Tax=Kineococcus halophytocola TaxID=3234027 RepID=A0ABV4H1D4_9ACTN